MLKITKIGALKGSLIAIVSVIVVEGVAGILTGSLALLSDSAHAAFDSLSTFVLLVATSLSLKPADEDHTYGHGKIESLGALIGGVLLFVLSAFILIMAVPRLRVAIPFHPGSLGYGAAAYTLTIDVIRMSVLAAALRTGSLSVRADLYHAISDFGSTALVFGALGLASLGYPVGDAVVSLILAGFLAYLSSKLIYASSLELSDAVSGKLVQSILREIRKTDEVLKVKELRARRVGQLTYVDAVVAISPMAGIVDAETIASKVEANLTKLLGKSSIMIHVEPLEWGVPVEMQIRNATKGVEGAKGLHNLSITSIGKGLYVTLHVQVDPSLPLDKAHQIAESVERVIQKSVPDVRQITVHLEPFIPESSRGRIVSDKELSEKIRVVVEKYPAVTEISSIMTYSTGPKLHINISCRFAGGQSISDVHELISKIEEEIRREFDNTVVTIHPEPVVGKEISR